MKHFIFFISLMSFTLVGMAQEGKSQDGGLVARDLKARVEGTNLQLSWAATAGDSNDYWEVQGSRDGKIFSTIGLVLGADPAVQTTSFTFKQDNKKLAPGMKYYRVLLVENETKAIASNMILLSK
jgi:hypothetical protein